MTQPKKASDELRDENKTMSTNIKELKSSPRQLKEKHDRLKWIHEVLNTRFISLKEDFVLRLIMIILLLLMSSCLVKHMMLLTKLLRLIQQPHAIIWLKDQRKKLKAKALNEIDQTKKQNEKLRKELEVVEIKS